MPKTSAADMPGTAFGCWLVVSRDASRKGWYWNCACVCGVEKSIFGGNLTSGKSVSCGHDRAEAMRVLTTKHGHSAGGVHTRAYSIYRGILQRCYNKKQKAYARYGAKGVRVCEDWLGDKGFANFLRDMGAPPEGTSIERKKNALGYSPENCIWADAVTQARNKSNVHLIDGVPKTVWAMQHGLSLSTLYKRARKEGCTVLEILLQERTALYA